MACILDALIAGDAARLVFSRGDAPGGQYRSTYYVDLLGYGHAVGLESHFWDSPAGSAIQRRQLVRPAEHFEGCAALTDDEAVWECLRDWSAGCSDEAAPCPIVPIR